MKFTKSLVLAAALGTTSLPALSAGHEHQGQELLGLIQRISAHYQILLARTFVDLTYDSVAVSPDGMSVTINGAKIYPELPWDQDGNCMVEIDRLASHGVLSFDTLVSRMDISGVNMPAACFDPDMGGMMQSFGYDGLVADNMSVDIAYNLPASSAEISVQASVVDAADVSISATLDYFWFRIPLDGYSDEPEPIAYLGEAEVSIVNNGLWDRLEPMVAAQMGDLNAVPQMIQMMGGQALGGPNGQPSPEAQAFLENLSAEVGRFVQEKNRLVITVAPERSVKLGPDAFGSPGDAIALLKPEVSGVPLAYRRMVSPDELAAALGGGGGLDDDARLRVGEALITGIGAPRSLADGTALLAPLANGWNGTAAMLVAQAQSAGGDSVGGYAMAMRALASGEAGAVTLADELEGDLSVGDMLTAQEAQMDAWPGAADATNALKGMLGAGDVGGLRRMANQAAIGKGMPRDYVTAYFLASLAAAGGDKGAANLRDRLDDRFGDDSAWQAAASAAAGEALRTWTGGLGATIANSVK